MASAASILTIQADILADCEKSENDLLHAYLSDWSVKFGDVQDPLPTKQPFWDRAGVLDDKAWVEASLISAHHRASLLAASSQHSGDWFFALPIASCGLRLDDEAVRLAVGLRLGFDFCIPHHCTVAPQLTLMGFIVLSAKETRAGQLGITLLTTWFLGVSSQQEFPSLKSRWGYFVLM